MSLDIKPHLRTYLLTSTELTTLVGSNVYADSVPLDAPLPFVFFRRQGSGIIDQFDVRDRARIQVICEADKDKVVGVGDTTPEQDAYAVWLAVEAVLHRKQNYTAGSATVRHSMRSAGPIDQVNNVTGNPQVVAYYIVRY